MSIHLSLEWIFVMVRGPNLTNKAVIGMIFGFELNMKVSKNLSGTENNESPRKVFLFGSNAHPYRLVEQLRDTLDGK